MKLHLSVVAGALLASCEAEPPTPALPTLDLAGAEPAVERALETARAAVAAAPSEHAPWLEYAYLLDAHQFVEAAETCTRAALDLGCDEFLPAYQHALLGALLGRELDEVLARYARAQQRREDYAPLYLRRAELLAEAGRSRAARTDFERAARWAPGDHRVQAGLGALLVADGEPEQALAMLERAHRAGPADPTASAALAQAYFQLDRPEEARAVAQRARAGGAALPLRDPLRERILDRCQSAWYRGTRAERRLSRGDHAGAVEDLAAVVEARPEALSVHIQLAELLLQLGRMEEAEPHWLAIIDQAPELIPAQVRLGQLYASTDRPALAVEQLEQVAGLAPLDAEAELALASSLARLARYAEAAAHFESVAALRPSDGPCRYQLAHALHLAGDQRAAEVRYREACDLAPGHPLAAALAPLFGDVP